MGKELYFAGEHTSEEHPATVVGAYLSGLTVARKARAAPPPRRRGPARRRTSAMPHRARACASVAAVSYERPAVLLPGGQGLAADAQHARRHAAGRERGGEAVKTLP